MSSSIRDDSDCVEADGSLRRTLCESQELLRAKNGEMDETSVVPGHTFEVTCRGCDKIDVASTSRDRVVRPSHIDTNMTCSDTKTV